MGLLKSIKMLPARSQSNFVLGWLFNSRVREAPCLVRSHDFQANMRD